MYLRFTPGPEQSSFLRAYGWPGGLLAVGLIVIATLFVTIVLPGMATQVEIPTEAVSSEEIPPKQTIEATAEKPPENVPPYPDLNKPVDMIRLPMIQCLNREELKALMAQCWEDAIDIAVVPNMEDKTNDWVFVGSRATLAAAIFAVRADNIQSGKEAYVREWAVDRGDTK